jgi:alkylation response protein AidB-like acyl-CoA dehydrogenase
MSVEPVSPPRTNPRRALPDAPPRALPWALEQIGRRAEGLDREPRFPAENLEDLALAGALTPATASLASDVRLVRAVAAADASTARILDGHLNGLERLRLCAPESLLSDELARIGDGGLVLGVWGADPVAGEGVPAHIVRTAGGGALRGVKTFCSGAGGVQRALVVAADPEGDGARRLAYLDVSSHVSVDRGWYRASGLRSSESHRVEFHDAPILALLGGPGELSREPHFSRDAIRTSATWAGLADCILSQTAIAIDPRRADELHAHALGGMRVARATIDRWLEYATEVFDRPEGGEQRGVAALALECRVALADCAQRISADAARVCGARPLVAGGALDRARRDLDLFVRQHRLEPKLTKLGRETLAGAHR